MIYIRMRPCSEIYRFNTKTKNEISSLIEKLDIKGPYVGIHIRGGDKIKEHPLLSIDSYFRKAEAMTDIRQAFVSSDDYKNIQLAKIMFPNWKIFTLTSKGSCGYDQEDFNNFSTNVKKQHYINLFSSVEMLSKADLAFCTFSSNIGMFLGILMADRAVGVDFDHWRIW